jgi:hypothetical protein
METATQFITAISNIQWSEYNNNTFTSENGFTLSWSTKFHEITSLPSVQIIAQVRYNDTYVMTWGFTDDESQRSFIAFIKTTKFKVEEAKVTAEIENKRIGLAILKG